MIQTITNHKIQDNILSKHKTQDNILSKERGSYYEYCKDD